MISRQVLDPAAVRAELAHLDGDWSATDTELTRSIEFAGFLVAVEFITRIAPVCEELDHHPDLDLRWRRVDITLSTHSAGGITALDVSLAHRIDELAGQLPR
jgi:4a-hydroxytetrahydrobiopterin dehydratase